jgi:hypothetical protein
MKEQLKIVGNWLLRHLVWIALILVAGYFIQPTRELIGKFLIITILEGMALGMSGLALFAYTKVNFIKKMYSSGDGTANTSEQLGASIITGLIFLGVHILVAGTFFILQLEVL